MGYTPKDIIDYIFEKNIEGEFIGAVMLHKGGYSIGEISDKRFRLKDGKLRFFSDSYKLKLDIEDEDIITAVNNGLYVTPFISRMGDSYNVHFLVHEYPENMKAQFEDEITRDVVRYMILRTVKALRLDTPGKVDEFCGINS